MTEHLAFLPFAIGFALAALSLGRDFQHFVKGL